MTTTAQSLHKEIVLEEHLVSQLVEAQGTDTRTYASAPTPYKSNNQNDPTKPPH